VALLADEGGFDPVRSDYRMAEINGLALLQRIKRDHPSVPVIPMTAYGTVEGAVEAMKSGAYDYVSKPFTLDQIQHVVTRPRRAIIGRACVFPPKPKRRSNTTGGRATSANCAMRSSARRSWRWAK
jgi:DNA-binding NtrC family response regulator